MQRQHARLGGGQDAKVLQQPRHDPRLFQDRFEVRSIGRVQAVQHGLGVPLDDRQRRAELVGHVGQEIAALFFAAAQTLGHGVERPGQPSHLTGSTLVDSDVVLTGRHPVGGLHHLAERLRGPSHGSTERDEAEEQQRQAGDAGGEGEAPMVSEAERARDEGRGQRAGDEGQREESSQDQADATDEVTAPEPPHAGARRGERLILGPPWRTEPGPSEGATPASPPGRPASLFIHRRTGSPRRARSEGSVGAPPMARSSS